MTTQLDQLDPRRLRLAAYALNELDDAERRAVEADLTHDAEGRAFVEEMRGAADLLVEELASEPAPPPLTELRKVVDDRLAQRSLLHRRPMRKRPLVWMPVSILLAILIVLGIACAAMFLILHMY